MTVFDITQIDKDRRLHPDSVTACRWLISAINDCLPRIENNYLKSRLPMLHELIATALADDDKVTIHCINTCEASKFVKYIHRIAYHKGSYVPYEYTDKAKRATSILMGVIYSKLREEDDDYKYEF